MNDDIDIESALRASLARNAGQAPAGTDLADRILAETSWQPALPGATHRRWSTWTLPLIASGAVAAAVGAVVVGVSAARHDSAPQPGSSVTTLPVGSSTAPPSPAPHTAPPTTAPTTPGPTGTAVAACGNSSLTISASRAQGATGHGSLVLLFQNTATASCSLYGYPGLDAIGAAGNVLGHASRTVSGFAGGSHHGVQTVIVSAGQYASATVEWMNFDPVTSGPCTISATVATAAANTTRVVALDRQVSLCDLQVHPTVLGSTGNS